MLTESTLVREASDFLAFDPLYVAEEDPALDIVRRLAAHPEARVIYVVDRFRLLRGVIPASAVAVDALGTSPGHAVDPDFDQDQENFPEHGPGVVARDLMQPAVQVSMDEPLVDVLTKMYENEAEEIAVVDADGHLVASLDAVRVLAAWAHRV